MRPVKGSAYDVAYTGTKGVTAEITEECVRVRCTSDAYVLIGQNADITPSSSAYDYFCAAGEAVDIKLFDTDKYIAAVQVSSGGTMYVNGWK
jgi:hypothetical protein